MSLKMGDGEMNILIIEDELIVAWDLRNTVEEAGHTVIGIATTVKEALALVGEGYPDLALVNINLKEGDGAGIYLARYLLDYYGVPSLFVSGQVIEARKNKDAALGYLGKPWRTSALLASIEVAQRLIDGDKPDPVPSELELFAG